MKTKTHPKLHQMVVRCACGASYELNGAVPQLQVEICRNCSPLFTGTEEKRVVMGQVEKFLKRKAAQAGKTQRPPTKTTPTKTTATKEKTTKKLRSRLAKRDHQGRSAPRPKAS